MRLPIWRDPSRRAADRLASPVGGRRQTWAGLLISWSGGAPVPPGPLTTRDLAESNLYSIRWSMSTKDQLLDSALYGTAMRYAAERRNLDESIEELRQIADGRNDILAAAAAITAGSWYASPATHVGYELIGAGMLILAGGGQGFPLDYVEQFPGRALGDILDVLRGNAQARRRLP
jgi:hypothetical protein